MGIITVSDEYASVIPRERIFKSLILDADNLLPKLLPQIIKSIDIAEGDGGAGTIKQMNFAEGLTEWGVFLNFLNSIGPTGSILLGMQFGYCFHLYLRGNYYNRKDSDKSKIGHDNLLAAGPRRRL